jgi:hypothetical protein
MIELTSSPMSLFFYFIMIFTGDGHLESVTASKAFHSIETCTASRDFQFHIKPVDVGDKRRTITHCAQMNLINLPRCR